MTVAKSQGLTPQQLQAIRAVVRVAKALSKEIPVVGTVVSAAFGLVDMIISGQIPDEVVQELKILEHEMDNVSWQNSYVMKTRDSNSPIFLIG